MEIDVRDERLRKAFHEGSPALYPYIFAGLRRAFGAYRREFNAGRHLPGKQAQLKGGKVGLRIRNPNQPGLRHQFFWRTHPANEKAGRLDDILVEFYTGSPVAKAMEFGATVRPKRGRALAIPVGYALSAKGRIKRNFRTPDKARARGFRFVYIPRRGNRGPYLAVDKNNPKGKAPGKRGKKRGAPELRVVFVLTPSVRIRKRLGFYAGWDRFEPERNKRLDAELARYLRDFWGVAA